ncbi:MAG: RNA-guided pseudouridylation complex pseudouridine synthase subunit Cbf5, partial [Thermoplasmata archaeon HGW-Thermoplasmata-2]
MAIKFVGKPIIKADAETREYYGKAPETRSIPELLDSGVIIIDKPSGPTSHQVSAWVRDMLGIEKAGHSGTLDPNVTGVLPVALGGGTKLVDELHIGSKEYVCVMRLHSEVQESRVREVMKPFVGKVQQMVPVRAAVKRQQRAREIYALEFLEMRGRDVLFRVECEAGTYVRTLCVDIGKRLGCGANMQELRRTRTAIFGESDLVRLQDLKDALFEWQENKNDAPLRKLVIPMERMVEHIPKIVIRDSAVDALCHGANLALPGVVQVDSGLRKGNLAAVFTLKEEIVAIGAALMDAREIVEKVGGFCLDVG